MFRTDEVIDTTLTRTTVDTLHPIEGEGAAEGTIITITTTIVMTLASIVEVVLVASRGENTGGMTGDVAMIGMEMIIEVILFLIDSCFTHTVYEPLKKKHFGVLFFV